MNHLTDEELLRLAEITDEQLIYSESELKMMEHLKFCKECYEKFCCTLALVEVTSESGYMVLSEMYDISPYIEDSVQKVANKILAVIDIVIEQIKNDVNVFLKQIEQPDMAFSFAPALAMGTRGGADVQSGIYKMEDMVDERTFISFDSVNNALFLQINTKKLNFTEIRAFIVFDSGEKMEISLEQKGKLLKGMINNISTDNFQIMIEGNE